MAVPSASVAPRRKWRSMNRYSSPSRIRPPGTATLTAPRIMSRLAAFAPRTLPETISDAPARTLSTEATSSGSDVPMATMNTPTTNGDMPRERPIRSAAAVKKRAATSSRASAAAKARAGTSTVGGEMRVG
jgi:hypothetical protein